MKQDSRIFVVSDKTAAGKAILKFLRARGYTQVFSDTEQNLSLISSVEVSEFFLRFKPEYVFFAGASSAGIAGNQKNPAGLASQNLVSLCHVLDQSVQQNTVKVLYLASSCVYPKAAPQPMKPEFLMTGPLETTCEAYAMAKLAGLSLARAYREQYDLNIIAAIPADIYGPEDSFDPENSHVVEALVRKVHEAKLAGNSTVTLWGSGQPVRDFIYSEDLAAACLFLMENYHDPAPVNISANQLCSIQALALKIKKITGFEGVFIWDETRPDGTPRKTLDAQPLFLQGWQPKFGLEEGLRKTCEKFSTLEVSAGVS